MRLLLLDKPGDDLLYNYKKLMDPTVHPMYLTVGKNYTDEEFSCNDVPRFKEIEVHQLMKIVKKKENDYSILDFTEIDEKRLNVIIKKYLRTYNIHEIYCSYDTASKLNFKLTEEEVKQKLEEITGITIYFYVNSVDEEFVTEDVVKKSCLTRLEKQDKEKLLNVYFSCLEKLKKITPIYEEKYRLKVIKEEKQNE